MKFYYFIVALLLYFTNIALSMDDNDNNNECPFRIQNIQINHNNLTLHLKLAPEIQNLRFLTLSIDEQELLDIEIPKKTDQTMLCILNSRRQYWHIFFSSPKPVDCTRTTIRHTKGSQFARITVPRIKK